MNFSVRELESIKPRLRENLNFSVQEHGSERVCVIEDPTASKFYRIGFDEYRFFRALDGRQNIAAILSRLARDAQGNGFDEAEAMQMLSWLKDNHLLSVESTRADASREQSRQAFKTAMTWLNPLMLRVPLGRPDIFFLRLSEKLRPLLGWGGFLLWLAVVLAGATHLALDWARFERGFEGILSRGNWLWLGAVWAVLKILHECGHGIYCRYFGARVREIGVIFILFFPMGYVDATASTGIASRWQRIAVSSAGMYVEVFFAAVAALCWSQTPDGAGATVLHNAVVMGSLVTFFFNANPLMRFDGYYILSDWIGIPNLAARSRGWVMRAFAWLCIGARRLRPDSPATPREWFIAAYGFSAWLWQIFIFATLLFAASVMLRGGGILFAALAALLWAAVPLTMFAREILSQFRASAGRASMFAARIFTLIGILFLILLVPYRKTVIAPGVVEFADTRILRAECPGFVKKLHTRDGDIVAAGDLLLELSNEETAAKLAKMRRDLAAQKQRARLAYNRAEVAEYQAEQSRAEGMEKALDEMERYLATLTIRAPISGRVTSRKLAQMQGAYFAPGDEILRIGEARNREIKLAINQESEPHFRAAEGHPVEVRIWGRGRVIQATLDRMDDQASRQPPHNALTALANGPLPVRKNESAEADEAPYELADPHFTATARMMEDASMLADGEIVSVKFRSPLGIHIFGELRSALARWIRRHGA